MALSYLLCQSVYSLCKNYIVNIQMFHFSMYIYMYLFPVIWIGFGYILWLKQTIMINKL